MFLDFFCRKIENSGLGPKKSTFGVKTKVVDLEKWCRTDLLINSGDLYLTISWMSKLLVKKSSNLGKVL